jgi:NADH:ubiquinone oxidoreductase subunit K
MVGCEDFAKILMSCEIMLNSRQAKLFGMADGSSITNAIEPEDEMT